MKLEEAKEQFVQVWGMLGSNWGINRTMAQVHALLLVSARSLSTEEIMEELSISRGNANMNIRELITWNLVYRESRAGERREFFRAEKDMWEVARRIATERKRREIQPLIRSLSHLKVVEGDKRSADAKAFIETVDQLQVLVGKMDEAVDILLKSGESKFFGTVLKLLK